MVAAIIVEVSACPTLPGPDTCPSVPGPDNNGSGECGVVCVCTVVVASGRSCVRHLAPLDPPRVDQD